MSNEWEGPVNLGSVPIGHEVIPAEGVEPLSDRRRAIRVQPTTMSAPLARPVDGMHDVRVALNDQALGVYHRPAPKPRKAPDLKAAMDATFQMRPGDRAFLATEIIDAKDEARLGGERRSLRGLMGRTATRTFQVVERLVQECHGGVQIFYRVRGFHQGRATLLDLTAEELIPHEEGIATLEALAAMKDGDS